MPNHPTNRASPVRWIGRPVTAGLLSLAMAGGVVGVTATPALAQEPEPFGCGADGILTQGPAASDPSTMQFIDMASGETTTGPTLDVEVNAIGYNIIDDLIYGHSRGLGLVRFGQNGEHEPLNVPADADVGTAAVLAGDVDENGHLWLLRPGSLDWFQVDVDPGSATYGELLDSGTGTGADIEEFNRGADWSYVPGTNALYQLNWQNDELVLFEFDRDTLTYSQVGDTGLAGGQFGATYADSDGFLYGSRNSTGEIVRIDVATGEGVHFTDGPPSEFNDGARCFTMPIPVDFGDAPDSYGTLLESNGARHSIPDFDAENQTAPLVIGENVSIEPDGLPSPGADADTFDDGVTEPIHVAVGEETTVTVTVTNDTDEDATLVGWLDGGVTGTFDGDDRSGLVTVPANSGTDTYELTFPAATSNDDTYARFRLYGNVQEDPSPLGEAFGGEVEDYQIFVHEPDIILDKSPDTDELVAGETITYTFTATNTGDEPIEDTVIEDTDFTGDGDLSTLDCDPAMPATLPIDDSLTCTATYEVTQADVDTGVITNTAQVTAVGTLTGADLADQDVASVPSDPQPELALDKDSDAGDDPLELGEVITYTFAASNVGNVTLSDVMVEETEFSGAGELSPLVCEPEMPATLLPGEVLTCTATYEVVQEDVDAGQITNTAIATGTPPGGGLVPPPESSTTVPSDPQPGITLDKSADPDEADPGDTVTFTLTAENTGNITLFEVEIEETDFTGAGELAALDCAQPTALLPGEELTCTTTYTVQEADEGETIINSAAVTASSPGNPDVTATSEVGVYAVPESWSPPASWLPETGNSLMALSAAGVALMVLGTGLVYAVHRTRLGWGADPAPNL